MDVLLDTHALLWFLAGDAKLSAVARRVIEDPANRAYVSVASIWEMAIKSSIGKLTLEGGVAAFVAANVLPTFDILEIQAAHALAVETMPWHHNDPFDRLLVAQATLESLRLVTQDTNIGKYAVTIIW